MSKHGENIYRRKDGRWEARYIFMRLPDGKAKYKSVYGKTHDIAKEKQLAGMLALAKDETSPCVLTVKELFTQYKIVRQQNRFSLLWYPNRVYGEDFFT